MKTFKVGDKVKCVDTGDIKLLNFGEIYTVHEVGNPFIYFSAGGAGFYPKRFELVIDENDLGAQCEKAYTLIGKNVKRGNTTYKITHVFIIKKGQSSSALVNEWLETHDFCVAVGNGTQKLPVMLVDEMPPSIRVENVGDYDAEVYVDKIVVGCQTIPWDKVEEIITKHSELTVR
jgi:hypothetical protein